MDIALSHTRDQKQGLSNGIMGMVFLLATEAMFFAGLISAYIVNRYGAMMWPPYGQPRLPVEVTAVNTVILISSAIFLFSAIKKFRATLTITSSVRRMLALAISCGAFFLLVQGSEWVRLLGFGLTTHSSLYGAFFYLIVGVHAAHVVAGLAVLFYIWRCMSSLNGEKLADRMLSCGLYWYFVVAVWPLLYILVYLI